MKAEPFRLPVAVIGAGPVGLAAAAHLLGRGFAPLVFEAANSIAASFGSVRHVRLFSPWRYNLDREAVRLLQQRGWVRPPEDDLPTAGEMIDRYLKPLSNIPAISQALHLGARVTHISRAGFDKVKSTGRDAAPFVIRVSTPEGVREHRVHAVLDASGTWNTPNPLGADGLPAIGEDELAHRIRYGMPDILAQDRARYAGKRVLVLGAGHSAAGNLISLAQLAEEVPETSLAWAIRGHNLVKVFGGGELDGLPARGQLGLKLKNLVQQGRLSLYTDFHLHELRLLGERIEAISESRARIEAIDEIIGATGARPDLTLARELRLKLDPWLESTEALAPLIDPNVHSCGTVRPHGYQELSHPEKDFFVVGAKSYGRAPNFLLATGYEQVRSVVAALAGDIHSATEVHLELPETGVCSTQFGIDNENAACCGGPAKVTQPVVISESTRVATPSATCCGGPAPADTGACCVDDAEAKAMGRSGCGCGRVAPPAERSASACCG